MPISLLILHTSSSKNGSTPLRFKEGKFEGYILPRAATLSFVQTMFAFKCIILRLVTVLMVAEF